MARKPITKDLTTRILHAVVYEDSFKNDAGESVQYAYIEITFNKKDGEYTKRFKGISADTIEILDNLTVPIATGSSLLDDAPTSEPVDDLK